jgi:hypothetical protein
MADIHVDVWLYGALSRYGGLAEPGSYANVTAVLPAGAMVGDLLSSIGLPSGERGITFINGELSAMPGLQPDLGHVLKDGDRIGLFDLRSMWPFQYRHGAAMIPEMRGAMDSDRDQGIHHAYSGAESKLDPEN